MQLFGQLTHRQQRSGELLGLLRRGCLPPGAAHAATGEHLRRESADRLSLHLTILELAEAILQALQVLDHSPVGGRLVQRAEELQQVAQLLAPLAQRVQLGARHALAGSARMRAEPRLTTRR